MDSSWDDDTIEHDRTIMTMIPGQFFLPVPRIELLLVYPILYAG